MKRILTSLVLVVLFAMPVRARAHEMSHHATTTLTGEVVDTGCYLGHAARGTKHAECAAKCINGGMPMGLLTATGSLYLITMNHDNPDAFNRLKAMAGKKVTVTGAPITRAGMRGIDVTSFKAAS